MSKHAFSDALIVTVFLGALLGAGKLAGMLLAKLENTKEGRGR